MKTPQKINIIFTDKIRGDWVGDWRASGEVRIHRKLKGYYRLGVIIHEITEMICSLILGIPECCSPLYSQKIHGRRNSWAHNIATFVEHLTLKHLGIDINEYEDTIQKIINMWYGDAPHPCDTCYLRSKCKVRYI